MLERLMNIDKEIDHRNKLRHQDFKRQVEELKHQKMLMKKEDTRKQKAEQEQRQREEEFMDNILEQKRQLLLEAIHSLGLDHQDLPKGTGLDKLKIGQ